MREAATYQETNAARQRQEIQERIYQALNEIRKEISLNLIEGRSKYPRRLSQGEILRRAGGVDKNTLKQPYHADLRKAVAALIAEVHEQPPAATKTVPPEVSDISSFAQLLVAAQVRRDAAEEKAREAGDLVAALVKQIADLKEELSRLRGQSGKVIQLAEQAGVKRSGS